MNKIVSKMGSDMDAMNNDLSKTGADMEAMNNDLSKTGADIDAMNNDLSKMDADMDAMNNDFSKMDADINAMNNDFSKMDADIEAMNNDFSKMEADIKAVIDIVLLEQKAECTPDCANGGVCFRNNTCKCKPFTQGPRCEKVICEDKCYENGGKCIGPGTCKCPEDKKGSNCEQQACPLPDVTAKHEYERKYFSQGEKLTEFNCDPGFILLPKDGITCLANGSWSGIIECAKAVYYLIRVRTGSQTYAGTDANVYITLHGQKGETDKIYLAGSFEKNYLDETRRQALDIRPITKVEIGHDGSGISSEWYLKYVSIYVEDMEEYYFFGHNDWVKEENDDFIKKTALIRLIMVINCGQILA